MEYNKLVSVTGMSGLFEMVSSKSDGAVVRSLEDKSTKFISSRVHNFSHLEGIEVFTVKDNVNLSEILLAMKSSAEPLPDTNDNKAIKAYFEKVYPTLDFERVYASDMKKMVKWYEVLLAQHIEIKLSETPQQDLEVNETSSSKTKSAEAKQSSVRNGPAKKVNAPRKMV